MTDNIQHDSVNIRNLVADVHRQLNEYAKMYAPENHINDPEVLIRGRQRLSNFAPSDDHFTLDELIDGIFTYGEPITERAEVIPGTNMVVTASMYEGYCTASLAQPDNSTSARKGGYTHIYCDHEDLTIEEIHAIHKGLRQLNTR